MEMTKWPPFINAYFILEKEVMRRMSKSALAASLLIWQEMSWGWMIDNVNAAL